MLSVNRDYFEKLMVNHCIKYAKYSSENKKTICPLCIHYPVRVKSGYLCEMITFCILFVETSSRNQILNTGLTKDTRRLMVKGRLLLVAKREESSFISAFSHCLKHCSFYPTSLSG